MIHIYLKIMTTLTDVAFALIQKANFKLDPDNVGLFAGLAIVAFTVNYFSKHLTFISKMDFGNVIHSTLVSS